MASKLVGTGAGGRNIVFTPTNTDLGFLTVLDQSIVFFVLFFPSRFIARVLVVMGKFTPPLVQVAGGAV